MSRFLAGEGCGDWFNRHRRPYADAGSGPIMLLVTVAIILLIGGQVLEPSGLLVITSVPIISTWLPTSLMGPEIITN